MTLDLLDAYRRCFLVRQAEQEIARRYPGEQMRCPAHLSVGQEVPAVAVCMALRQNDVIYSNHRSHAHYLAKGGSVDGLIAELYGKATGCAGGWGGSMHLVDEAAGMMGTSAIVGSAISVAVGHALAFKLAKRDAVAVAFFGDSALETGQLYEAINFAALYALPVMFVCENNGYATQTPLSQRQPDRPFREVALAMGLRMASQVSDSHGIEAVYEAALRCRDHTPSFLEIETYRWLEHVGPNRDDALGYRSKAEVDAAIARDPVHALWQRIMVDVDGIPNAQQRIIDIEDEVKEQVSLAFVRAEAAPWPEVIR